MQAAYVRVSHGERHQAEQHDDHRKEERVEAVENVVACRVADGSRVETEVEVERPNAGPAEVERDCGQQRRRSDYREDALQYMPVAGCPRLISPSAYSNVGLVHAADRMPIRGGLQDRRFTGSLYGTGETLTPGRKAGTG